MSFNPLEETRMTLEEAAAYVSDADATVRPDAIRRWITNGVAKHGRKAFLEGYATHRGLCTTKEALNRFVVARAELYRRNPPQGGTAPTEAVREAFKACGVAL